MASSSSRHTQQFIPEDGVTYTKAGSLIATGMVSGADVAERTEAGSLIATAMLSGADVAERSETGALITTGLLSGADVSERSESGALIATGLLSGVGERVVEYVKAGTLAVGGNTFIETIGLAASLADDFNRADEDPLDGGGAWDNLDPALTENLLIASTVVAPTGTSSAAMSYRTAGTQTDVSAAVTFPSAPTDIGGTVSVLARVTDEGTSLWNGYQFQVVRGMVFPFNRADFQILRVTDGAVDLTIADSGIFSDPGGGLPNGPFAINGGDKLMLRIVGSRLEGWHHDGTEWLLRCVGVDTTWTTGTVGISINDATGTIDDFRVATADVQGTILSGADVAERSETGSLITTGLLSGADVTTSTRTGSLIATTLLSGASAVTYTEAGSLIATSTLSGTDVAERSETGSLISTAMLSGAPQYTAVETGTLAATGMISGVGVKSAGASGGTLIATGMVSGADVAERTEAGTLASTAVVSGADATTSAETGSLVSTAMLSGADVATSSDTGALISTGLISGVGVKESPGKAGSLISTGLLSGADVAERTEGGTLAATTLLSGADAVTYVETVELATTTWLMADTVLTLNRTGALITTGELSGFNDTAPPWFAMFDAGSLDPETSDFDQGSPTGESFDAATPGQVVVV